MSTSLSLTSVPKPLRPIINILALTLAFFFIPTAIHHVVRSIDTIYELLGRRASSPYDTTVPWASLFVAGGVLLAWHFWLGRLGYVAITQDDHDARACGDKGKKLSGSELSWDRVLGRIVIPFLLLALGVHFAIQVFGKTSNPGSLVVGNTVDRQADLTG